MKIPFLALILQGIPEQIAIIVLACVIAQIKLRWKIIIPMSVIIALTSYLLRSNLFGPLQVVFGIHTVILMILLIILMTLWLKADLIKSIIGSLASYLILIVTETLCLAVIIPMFEITPEILSESWIVRFLAGLPQLVLLLVAAYIIHKIHLKK